MIGEFIIQIAPIMEETPLVIGLNLDRNGLLVAHAMDEVSGQQVTCNIDYHGKVRMSQQEVEARRAELARQMEAGLGTAAAALATAGLAGGASAMPGASAGMSPGGMPGGMPSIPLPPPGMAPAMAMPMPPPGMPASTGPQGDPTAGMPSMARDVLLKAKDALFKVPPERAMQLLQASNELETAARSGNMDAVNRCTLQLLQLLQGT